MPVRIAIVVVQVAFIATCLGALYYYKRYMQSREAADSEENKKENDDPVVVIKKDDKEYKAIKDVKIVLVGDTTVGKTCLIRTYMQQDMTKVFSDDYEPNVHDVYKGTKQFEGQQIELEINDVSGDTHLGINRQVCYRRTDCFMICVALNNCMSIQNVKKWCDEIRLVCPDAPIILVGTKSDLRVEVSGSDLKQKSLELSLQAFCQTSIKNWRDKNVNTAFLKAIRTGFYHKYPKGL